MVRMPNPQETQVVELLSAIDSKLAKVHTQSLDLSFNELLDMYKSSPIKELDINPDYQRLFRWSEGARSRFIESLLLEMPVPPI
jgi:3'-phosphoadenosine 5'-phosphosulfate sulfotransferase